MAKPASDEPPKEPSRRRSGTVSGPSKSLSSAQRRYLERGLSEPGGKLPLFDKEGREIDRKTVESCVAHGWAAPWFANPLKPDWLVCKLTDEGYRVLGRNAPSSRG